MDWDEANQTESKRKEVITNSLCQQLNLYEWMNEWIGEHLNELVDELLNE